MPATRSNTQGLGRRPRIRAGQPGTEPATDEGTIILGRQPDETTEPAPAKTTSKTTAAKTEG